MSKKQHQLNRLKSLFTDLEGNQTTAIPGAVTGQPVIVPEADVAALPAQSASVISSGSARISLEPANMVFGQSAQVWPWEINAEGNFVFCGPEVTLGLGAPSSDFIGQPIRTYRLHTQSIEPLAAALRSGEVPTETDVFYQHENGRYVAVRLTILSGPDDEKNQHGWRGFAQTIPTPNSPSTSTAASKITNSRSATQNPEPFSSASPRKPFPKRPQTGPLPALETMNRFQGISVDAFGKQPAVRPISEAGKETFSHLKTTVLPADKGEPAAIAVPINAGAMGNLVLEVVDDLQDRNWTDDERQMVLDIANQLALALENARLYNAAQQELAERIRAEEAILRRNQDLALLNQLGQRLSSLTSRSEVFTTLVEMVGQVLDNRELIICSYDKRKQIVSFPVYRQDGQVIQQQDRTPGHEMVDYAINLSEPLLLTENVAEHFRSNNILLPERMPLSWIGIPMRSGETHLGALIIQDFKQENAPLFDPVHLELLSTAAAQAATALENAYLFEQMQEALRAIENRERYQGGVAQAAASLSEFGTQALPDVLKYLGHSAQSSRVYLLVQQEGVGATHWRLVEDWTSPMFAYLFDRGKIHNIPSEIFQAQIEDVRSNGWAEIQSIEDATPAGAFLRGQKIQTTLLLHVPAKGDKTGLLVFDQIDYRRRWLTDEINILRVATDAIANTYVREDLLGQLQANLDETESLYKASNRLVVSSDYQEMLTAVITGVKTAGINRGVMVLFDYDNYGKLHRIVVQGNWYSGYGTPPAPVGTEFPRGIYERFLLTPGQTFIEDVMGQPMDDVLRQELLNQNVRSLAIVPMISGKRQIGALLVQGEQVHTFSGRETRTLPPLVDQLTIAVENLRLFEQTQTALAETALLYNIGSSIAQAQDADDMVTLVVENVLPRGASRAALMLVNLSEDGEFSDLEIVGFRDLVGDLQMKGKRLKLEEIPILRSLSDEGLVINAIDEPEVDEMSRQTLTQCQVGAIVFIPLRSGGRLVGILSASSQSATQFDQADVRLLRTVGNSIAVALEKQRLLRQAQRRALELQTASEIARDTTSTLTLDLLLNRIVNLLASRFNYASASIYFIDANHSYAVLRESTGDAGEHLKQEGHRLAVGSRSVIGTVAASGEPVILNDVSASPLYMPHPAYPETRSEMALPLRIGKRITGVLDLQANQTNAFSPDDVNVLGILTDQIAIAIENARAYELSQKAIEDMREVDRVKSQFLANMSHELRTPLNSIIGFSRVILKGIDGPVTEMQTQDLTAIYNSGQHLLMLINDILDLSKIEAGKMELAFSDVNLGDLVNSAMSTAVGLVKDKPIKLVADIQKDLPLVRADSTRVRQVLINFLSNAAKFTDQGSITVGAKVGTDPIGRPEVMVTVADTGPGIAEADRAKLFLPFSQVDDSPTRKTGGTGLGLSICRSLIELHGGRIGLLASEVGKGSTFFFTLPMPQRSPNLSRAVIHEGTNVILSIDDDPQVISLYQRYLQPQGYMVIPHSDPRTAVQAARQHHPIAITLDVMMPERDGWQVMQELKNDPMTKDIPIIVCSILEEEEKGFNLGAADYLVKPFLQDDLLNALNRMNQTGKIRNVLVIDDDAEDLRLVKKMLEEDRNLKVTLAQGGKNGWNAISASRPDAIIMDLLMPDLDGFSLLGNMRMDPALRDIPVIILTGADLTPEQHQKLNEFGKQLLSKGYLREKELLLTLEDTLNRIRRPAAA